MKKTMNPYEKEIFLILFNTYKSILQLDKTVGVVVGNDVLLHISYAMEHLSGQIGMTDEYLKAEKEKRAIQQALQETKKETSLEYENIIPFPTDKAKN